MSRPAPILSTVTAFGGQLHTIRRYPDGDELELALTGGAGDISLYRPAGGHWVLAPHMTADEQLDVATARALLAQMGEAIDLAEYLNVLDTGRRVITLTNRLHHTDEADLLWVFDRITPAGAVRTSVPVTPGNGHTAESAREGDEWTFEGSTRFRMVGTFQIMAEQISAAGDRITVLAEVPSGAGAVSDE
jgi:hypothetical protein